MVTVLVTEICQHDLTYQMLVIRENGVNNINSLLCSLFSPNLSLQVQLYKAVLASYFKKGLRFFLGCLSVYCSTKF